MQSSKIPVKYKFSIHHLSLIIYHLLITYLELCRNFGLSEVIAQKGLVAHEKYPLLVPKSFVAKMEKGNPRDPLLLQILPRPEELDKVDGFSDDPLREQTGENHCPLLQKYDGRVLLFATNRCAVHCRYCFRRNLKKQPKVDFDLPQVPLPAEVILSGGDPLTFSDDELSELLTIIRGRPGVRRIRIHTRFPVVDPKRWTAPLLSMLHSDRKTVFSMVLHINHPREIDDEFTEAITEAVHRGIPIFVQSVLLREINDDFETLFELYEKLISLRMVPYYLHQLDRIAGAAHFEVDPKRGLDLIDRLHRSLPGYAVPRYVREVPGERSKVPVSVSVETR